MKGIYSILFISLMILINVGCSEQSSTGMTASEYHLFIGTYTGQGSEGIYLYRFNSEDGSVDSVGAATGVENPSYLAISSEHSALYAVNEIGDSSRAAVSAFAFDRKEGTLQFLNRQNSRGGAPCYISLDQSAQAVFAGNYVGGSLTMFPVQDDGSLREAKNTIQHTGSSVNVKRQNSPHVHYAKVSPSNDLLFVNDLGTDKIMAYPFDEEEVSLGNDPVITINAEPGAGPRHLTFHPSGEFVYVINELNGSVDVFRYEDESMSPVQTISTIPGDYKGEVSGADIHLSPDGEFLYASNREDLNNIVIYKVDQGNGTLDKIGEEPSGGVHPRNFMIDPTGRYLLAANRHTNNIVIFKRDKETGLLTPTGNEVSISQPVSLQMMAVD